MLRARHAVLLAFFGACLSPNVAYAQAFGGRVVGLVLFAPIMSALLLAGIFVFAGKDVGPLTRTLQLALAALTSACVGLSTSLFAVSPLWFASAMLPVFALARNRAQGPQSEPLTQCVMRVLDPQMLVACAVPGSLALLLWS